MRAVYKYTEVIWEMEALSVLYPSLDISLLRSQRWPNIPADLSNKINATVLPGRSSGSQVHMLPLFLSSEQRRTFPLRFFPCLWHQRALISGSWQEFGLIKNTQELHKAFSWPGSSKQDLKYFTTPLWKSRNRLSRKEIFNPRGKGKAAELCQEGYWKHQQLKTHCLGDSRNGTKHLAGECFGSS